MIAFGSGAEPLSGDSLVRHEFKIAVIASGGLLQYLQTKKPSIPRTPTIIIDAVLRQLATQIHDN